VKILLLGYKGYLGSFLQNQYEVDIEEKEHNYDYIINCIGKPDLEFCEKNLEISYESNFNVINKYIKKYNKSKILNFSSYYVYDDLGECSELSNTTNAYNYCLHKLMSEKAVDEIGGVSFRVGKLFGSLDIIKQNKLTEILLRSNDITLDEVRFNPTSLYQIKRVIDYEFKNKNLVGIFNLSNKGTPTHFEYGDFIKHNWNPYLNINRIKKHERVFHNYGKFTMSCDKLEKFITLVDWKIDLKNYLGSIKCC